MPSIGGLGHGIEGPGALGSVGAVNGGMMGGLMGNVGGFPSASAPSQRSSKKVPDWLVQTLKQQEALEAKQKKKEGISLSTDVASSTLAGAGNISGYNLVHSPSPSPPGSPSDRGGESGEGRTKPSWQNDSDDSADEMSPKKLKEAKSAANGSVDGGDRNDAKPSGILKKSSGPTPRGMGRVLEDDDVEEDTVTEAASATMDEATRASFDREIMRLLTRLFKECTDNIIREVASSTIEEARDSATAATEAARRAAEPQPPKMNRKQQREQKRAIGALIGGYDSESASESDGDVSSPQTAVTSATISGKATASAEVEGRGPPPIAAPDTTSSQIAARKPKLLVGGKWPLPPWADPPHETPVPDGLSIVVETIGPNLEKVKTQELSYSTTVLGRFEEQCGFVVEDSSASRCHAAIL